MNKCCHTENVNKLLGAFYCSYGRYPVVKEEKMRSLKDEFKDSPTGLSVDELITRCRKYESARFSYWRSEERRRLLGIAGYGQLLTAPTVAVVKKVLQLIGQRYCSASEASLTKKIMLARHYIRKITVGVASKSSDFWGGFYTWNIQCFPSDISHEEWSIIRREDRQAYL